MDERQHQRDIETCKERISRVQPHSC